MATKQTATEKVVTKKEILQLQKESMELVIKRSGIPKSEIYEAALKRFFVSNLDLLTPAERVKYKPVILRD